MAKSHIAIPKTTLLQFSNNGHIYYLDVLTNKIHHALAKTYNTEDDYYPEHIENYLSSEIETTIGRLRKLMDDFTENTDKIEFTKQMYNDAVKCVAIQLIRIPIFMSLVKSKSVFAGIIDAPDIYYSPLHRDDHDFLKDSIETTSKVFSGYEMNVCIIPRGSSFSFILPSTHCINVGNVVFLILSPYRSLVLLPASENEKNIMPDGGLAYMQINQYSEIESLYIRIIESERNNNRGGKIIGLKKQLELIQKSIASDG